jgi:hypothetical protein
MSVEGNASSSVLSHAQHHLGGSQTRVIHHSRTHVKGAPSGQDMVHLLSIPAASKLRWDDVYN